MRDVCQPILFSRLDIDSIENLRGLTDTVFYLDGWSEREEAKTRRIELCGAVR